MIDAVMYGMIPRKKIATLVIAPPAKRSRKPTTPPFVRVVLEVLDRREVDVGHGQVRAEPVDRDDDDREEDLVPQVGRPGTCSAGGTAWRVRLQRDRPGQGPVSLPDGPVNRSGRARCGSAVGERVVGAGRRSPVAPRRREDLGGATRRRRWRCGRPAEKACAFTVSGLVTLAAAEHLDQTTLGDEALGRAACRGRRSPRPRTPRRCRGSPRGTRPGTGSGSPWPSGSGGERRLTALEPGLDGVAGALALVCRGRRSCRPCRRCRARRARRSRREPGAGFRSWILIVMRVRQPSSTRTRCGTLAIMPRISGRSGSSTVWSIRRRPSARSVPRCFGLRADPRLAPG